MPHAVLTGARELPDIPTDAPIARHEGVIHKVVEVARTGNGLLLKSLVVDGAIRSRFLVRVDQREDGIVVRLDDHMDVERSPAVFDHLAAIAERVLASNPEARVGQTNLKLGHAPHV